MTPIYTKRLLLRSWREEEAEIMFHWAQNPNVGPIAGWREHRSVEESREIIRTVFSAPETYAMVLRSTGEPIGSIALKIDNSVSPSLQGYGGAELGYWLAEPYWGQGLTSEAVRTLIHRAFNELGYKRLWCGYYDGNERSRRVMEKCGFHYHHTEYNKPTLLGDIRTEHFMVLDIDEHNQQAETKE